MSAPDIDNPCPACRASDLGDVIPPETNKAECYGPQGTRWRRHIGIEDPFVYDGISWHKCWSCGHIWSRFPWTPEYGSKEHLRIVSSRGGDSSNWTLRASSPTTGSSPRGTSGGT